MDGEATDRFFMLIGILQTGRTPEALRPTHGDYPDAFARLLGTDDFTYRTWVACDDELPDNPQECDGWLITGSKFGAYDGLPWIARLEDFIRRCFADDVPMVGICFGHQVIAQALGGKVEKYSGGWVVGRTEYDWDGEVVALNAWHQDQVTRRPEGAEVLASNAACRNAALLYDRRILTIQAHPEFTPGFLHDLAETRGRGMVPDALIDAAEARLGDPLDSARTAGRIAQFFKTREVV